jgi:hypothetical protein
MLERRMLRGLHDGPELPGKTTQVLGRLHLAMGPSGKQAAQLVAHHLCPWFLDGQTGGVLKMPFMC